ncbi:hypothetical protein MPTK1_7g18780 [Marchantia polymorpha subsp. ruderalis]|uniref:Uncharacterized protein n=2 Tax=Marchantia polymorpha TaxID=3197 RepID=A0AAF6C173_MARPO|nr:hypothetical protein MARPO_0067s0099 [Marchantia polymorpha]BBN18007.1 hypothetical protein Mp_7g18780 [Marchantia polymorpha subsp. ruderalis]|eukprot:PTQ36028.1 hypothetical protein MARPO_0067s0099 [Marchantia polymorpha]
MASESSQNSRGSAHGSRGIEDEWQQVDMATSLPPPDDGAFNSARGDYHRTSPSRKELLSIVRKQPGGIGSGDFTNQEPEAGPDAHFWQQMLDMYFVRGLVELKAEKKSDEDDDLIFFVSLEGVQHGNGQFSESNDSEMQPYFVRRWAPELEKVLGNSFWEVDWSRSFYLNLIAHTSFSLTIAICSRENLKNHQHGSGASLTPIYKVTKTVYASPSRTNFQPDSKATETVAAYPDICFVVDDYDFTFNDVVLTEADHCYCVLLNARGGAAFPTDEEDSPEDHRTSREARMLGEVPQGSTSPKVTLFSGFVNYDMVRNAFEGGKRPKFEDIFHMGEIKSKSERLIMRGPGGRGEVEVAVSAVATHIDVQQIDKPPPSPTQPRAKLALGSIMRKAAVVASAVAKNVAAAASDNGGGWAEGELIPLRCCLMSLSLPWDTLARDLLFKELAKQDR